MAGSASDPLAKLRKVAEPLLGAPYRSGGESLSGFDCSGFVRTVLVRELVFWALLFPGGLIFGIPPLVDWLLFFRADRRCGHDHLAGTRVVTGAAS